jgi:hexokinase
VRWTKGFDVRDGVGHDPVQCLQHALRSLGWRGRVTALVNDGVALLGAAHYADADVCASFILGTGTLYGMDLLTTACSRDRL